MAKHGRGGSRSPRRGGDDQELVEGYVEGRGHELPDWNVAGLPPPDSRGPSSLVGQLKSQREFLEQFVRQNPLVDHEPAPREFSAGLPLEAARSLLLGPGGDGIAPQPWHGLPAHIACLAAATRLFAALLAQQAHEELCGSLCAAAASRGVQSEKPDPSCIFEGADAWKLVASAVSQATDSLQTMVRNQPVACCALLEDYVGVLEDRETGEEGEVEVGAHCVMVVGGDLSGPSFVVFDPWGSEGGEVAYWSLHDLQKASPTAWVELAPAQLVSTATTTDGDRMRE